MPEEECLQNLTAVQAVPVTDAAKYTAQQWVTVPEARRFV